MRQAPRRFAESELRQALIASLRLAAPTAQILEELGIEHGGARIDVALLDQGLAGFEIKSDFDSLDRLAHQMHAYHRVFDTLTVVTTTAFVSQVELLLPTWWGLWVAGDAADGAVRLNIARPATTNPRQEARSLLTLLWREEVLMLARAHAPGKVRASANRATLYDQLAAAADVPTVRQWVADALGRRAWRGNVLRA
jgi:hypothetical protein